MSRTAIDLSARRINWSLISIDQIDAIRRAAHEAGDRAVERRAARALARR